MRHYNQKWVITLRGWYFVLSQDHLVSFKGFWLTVIRQKFCSFANVSTVQYCDWLKEGWNLYCAVVCRYAEKNRWSQLYILVDRG